MDRLKQSFIRLPFGIAVAVVLSVALVIVGLVLPETGRRAYIVEGGFLETATVVAYAALILALIAMSGSDRKFFLGSAAITGLALARELDLHNRKITSAHLLKLRTYTGDGVPLWEKLIMAAVLLLIGLLLVWYAASYARGLWRRLRAGDSAGYGVLTALVLLVLAKLFDLLVRTVREITGIVLDPGIALKVAEESFELVAPLVLVVAVLQQRLSIANGPLQEGSVRRSRS